MSKTTESVIIGHGKENRTLSTEAVLRDGKRSFTSTAPFNSLAMGLIWEEAVMAILSMTPAMFYKSMPSTVDHTLWHDVYHAPCRNGKTAYVKATMQAGAVVIQF